ncbi:hypothetical protein LUZ63_004626 [Rhynchospora breviuscula]|uniref:UDP-glycosyltransferases domain-containing protein n=1 Tax=Rhynchospora breviuscula TaxID=2022672 RepID=A0A9Q0CLB8_9POAL|nr:hypothetical protein LUZ63_004626 [Rhynchospora breviuscula]
MSLLRDPLAALLAEHSPTCLVSDYRCSWIVDMGIPRIVFQPTGAFSAAVSDIVYTYEPHKRMEDPMEQFLIPGGIPHLICITRSELPGIFNLPRDAFQSTKESLCQCLGVIFHTFYELEPWYVDYLKESGPKKVWCAGEWPGKNRNKLEGLENKGRILTRWAPQVEILNHPSIGGFVTHCGWNSSLEAIAAGVPVAGWPQRAEQFLNERLLVEVMGVGVSMLGEGEARLRVRQRGIVGKERVREVVCELMGGGERAEAVEWRNRAAEYSKMAKEAVKDGAWFKNSGESEPTRASQNGLGGRRAEFWRFGAESGWKSEIRRNLI